MTIDYEKAWVNLKCEITDLQWKEVQQIPPAVVLAYMDFIEDIEQWESIRGEAKGDLPKDAKTFDMEGQW